MNNASPNNTSIKVGIAGRINQTKNYENACISLGMTPCTSLSLSKLSTCDALILPGGGDITPGFYGQEKRGSRSIDTELDLLQIQALEFSSVPESLFWAFAKACSSLMSISAEH